MAVIHHGGGAASLLEAERFIFSTHPATVAGCHSKHDKSFSTTMAKQPRYPATVGPFTFAYPHLTSPDSEGQYADNKYKVDGVAAPTSDAVKKAKQIIQAAMKDLGAPKDAQLPLKRETAKDASGKRVETGNLIFRTKSQFAPAIVDASGKPIPEKTLRKLKIGAGSEGLLQGYFQAYTMKAKERVNGKIEEVEIPGLSFTLTGVQLIKLVKGGQSSADFAAYEGGGFSIDEEGDDGEDLDIGSDDDDSSDSDEDNGGLDI